MPKRSFIRFSLNGQIHDIYGSDAFLMLSTYLRQRLGLTGTKVVCAEGDCGACTVLRARQLDKLNGSLKFVPINSCIAPLVQLDGCHLITIEAIGTKEKLSPVQQAMVQCHGSQCGYCTPGMVMTLTGLFDQCPQKLDEQSIKNALTGNLCRCTGYASIMDAAQRINPAEQPHLSENFTSVTTRKALLAVRLAPIEITCDQGRIFAPVSLTGVSQWRKKYPTCHILNAGTDLGVQVNKGKISFQNVVSLHQISELHQTHVRGAKFSFGARVPLEEVRHTCATKIPEFSRLLNVFASPQIKQTATLVGNIANASPIGDTLPFLMVADATVSACKSRSSREIPLTELYTSYRQLALKPDEIIQSVSFRAPRASEFLRLYKTATRKDLDIATVSAAFLFDIQNKKDKRIIRKARIAFGGIAPVPLRISTVEEFLEGQEFSLPLLDQAADLMQQQISPIADVRGSAAYRRVLVKNLFHQYGQDLAKEALASHDTK